MWETRQPGFNCRIVGISFLATFYTCVNCPLCAPRSPTRIFYDSSVLLSYLHVSSANTGVDELIKGQVLWSYLHSLDVSYATAPRPPRDWNRIHLRHSTVQSNLVTTPRQLDFYAAVRHQRTNQRLARLWHGTNGMQDHNKPSMRPLYDNIFCKAFWIILRYDCSY